MKSFATVPLAICLLAGASQAADFLPIETGNVWTYRNSETGESFTIRVGTPLWTQSGRVYYALHGYAGRQALARVDEQGRLVALDEESGGETLLTAFAAHSGEWWEAQGRECALEGQTQDRRGAHAGPAGRWDQVLEIQYRSSSCADAGAALEQFAENIGMVRRIVGTIAGPRVFDLVYARIGNQVIDTQDRGRFTISATQAPGRDYWEVTLRLDLGLSSGVRLRFSSGQEYDVALRDEAGKVVWTWSDGRFFDQAAQEKTFGNEWTATVRVPYPSGAASWEGYTLEGWLTTAPGEPKFAAAGPVAPAPASNPGDTGGSPESTRTTRVPSSPDSLVLL